MMTPTIWEQRLTVLFALLTLEGWRWLKPYLWPWAGDQVPGSPAIWENEAVVAVAADRAMSRYADIDLYACSRHAHDACPGRPTSLGHALMATEPSTQTRTTPIALIGWIVFVLLVVYSVLIGGAWAGIYLVHDQPGARRPSPSRFGCWFRCATPIAADHAIWPTLVVPPVVLALATLASSTPRLGLEYVAWSVLLVGLYLLLVRILATQLRATASGRWRRCCRWSLGCYTWARPCSVGSSGGASWVASPRRPSDRCTRPQPGGSRYGRRGTSPGRVVRSPPGHRGSTPSAHGCDAHGTSTYSSCPRGQPSSWIALAGAAVFTGGIWLITATSLRLSAPSN